MICVIIPTINRSTLIRAVNSVTDNGAFAIIQYGGTAGDNRNKGIKEARKVEPDWIVFLDDDDYLLGGWQDELDNDKDIVVLRMLQNGAEIPDRTNELRFANVGINFALNMNKIDWSDLPKFDDGEGEDWRFLEKLLYKYKNVKITDNIYYYAEKRSYNV
jgi:glycosyltransferase involved in cell wall biosynthesis